VVRDGRILATSGMEGAQMLAAGALMAFLPLYGRDIGLNAGEIGLLFGAMGIASIGARPLLGALSDRIGRRGLIVVGQALCAGVMLVLPAAAGVPALAGLAVVFGLGEALLTSSTSAFVSELVTPRAHGAAMGLFGTIMDVGHASGPILAGVLIGSAGYSGAFGAIGLLLLGVTGLFAWTARAPRPRS
jgi:MFS family permease